VGMAKNVPTGIALCSRMKVIMSRESHKEPTLNSADDVCGYGPFSLPPDHPFTPACRLHDWDYELSDAPGRQTKTRDEVDRELLRRMLLIAKANNSIRLRAEAYVFYGLARTFGALFVKKYWPKDG